MTWSLFFLCLSTIFSPLQDYRWKNRIILLSGASADIERQLQMLLKGAEALEDRQLLIFRLDNQWMTHADGRETDISCDEVSQYFDLNSKNFQLVLIGKDGFEKGRWGNEVSIDILFALIDQMPMRKQEMKEKSPH